MNRQKLKTLTVAGVAVLAGVSPVYAADTTSSNSSNVSNIVFFQRGAVSGPSDQVVPQGKSKGNADTHALTALKGASYYQTMLNDYAQGKYIVLSGNTDGKLNISLLSRALGFEFDVTPGKKTEIDALAVWQDSQGTHMIEFDGPANSFTKDSITSAIQTYIAKHHGTTTSNQSLSISPSSTPNGSNGNYSYQHTQTLTDPTHYQTAYDQVGELTWGYEVHYMGKDNSGKQVWGVHLDNIVTPGCVIGGSARPTQNSAFWGSINVGNYYGESLLHDVYPANNGWNTQGSTTLTLTYPPSLSWTWGTDTTSVQISDHTIVSQGSAAWQWDFGQDTNQAKSTYTYAPGADFECDQNSTYVFEFTTDNVITEFYYGTYSSTGDMYDTVSVSTQGL